MSVEPPPYQEYDSLTHSNDPAVTVNPNVNTGPFVPEDFKYSTTIVSCDFQVRQQFMARVYSILSSQLLTTLSFCYATSKYARLQLFIVNHTFLYIFAMITTLLSCIWLALSPRKEDYQLDTTDPLLINETTNDTSSRVPWYCLSTRGQYILLAIFTISESYCLGGSIMFESKEIVLNALTVTSVVVIGVSLMAFSGRFQIALESATSIYYWLNLAVLLLIGIGLSAILFGGMNSTISIIYGWVGAVVFSIYLFIDTQLIFRKIYLGEEIRCAMMLYLDIINLFLSILRILSSQNNDD